MGVQKFAVCRPSSGLPYCELKAGACCQFLSELNFQRFFAVQREINQIYYDVPLIVTDTQRVLINQHNYSLVISHDLFKQGQACKQAFAQGWG